jgi:hypothetical protein
MVEQGAHAAGTEPAFEFDEDDRTENFDLRPKDNRSGSISEEQRKISHEVYEARNILKLLKEKRAFQRNDSYKEFIERVVQAATVGCVARHVDTKLAAEALEQIRTDVVRRNGRPIMYRYLTYLAAWALGGVLVGWLVIAVAGSKEWRALQGYGWIIIGSMVGSWISVAATRREISFDGIQDFLDVRFEPFIRMLFVGCISSVFALFLQLKLIPLTIAEFDLATFAEHPPWALLIGVIAGISEKAVSVQVVERARKVLSPESP